MLLQTAKRIAVTVILLFALAHPTHAAEQKLGLVTQVEGEGFFLNPLVTKILVTEVTNGSLAEAAGVKAGDQIIQIDGETIAGKRALDLRRFLKLNPGETRKFRLKHADGTEADVRITKPKTS